MICNKSVYRKSICKIMISAICVSLFSAVSLAEETASAASNTPIAVFPLTTKSPEARRLVEEALDLYLDKVEQEAGKRHSAQRCRSGRPRLRHGTRTPGADQPRTPPSRLPNSRKALRQPEVTPRQLRATAHPVVSRTPPTTRPIAAITEMNDVLSQYPHDKWVVFRWPPGGSCPADPVSSAHVAVYEHSGNHTTLPA